MQSSLDMEDKIFTIDFNYDISNESIHKFAVSFLLGRYDSELILMQGDFSYKVSGGQDGHLYYNKHNREKWILIANWCFYRLYMVVRYRKPIWLRKMYSILFSRMNFTSITFDDYSIELLCSDGQKLRNRRFRLSPPLAFDKVMSEQFNFTESKIELLKKEFGLD